METQAQTAIAARLSSGDDKAETSADGKRNIFRTILANPSLPPVEKVYDRISQEGVVAIAAGGETTGRALSTATFFLLSERDSMLPRLQQEVLAIMPEPSSRPTIKELERLPLLVSRTISHHRDPGADPASTDCHYQGNTASKRSANLKIPARVSKGGP